MWLEIYAFKVEPFSSLLFPRKLYELFFRLPLESAILPEKSSNKGRTAENLAKPRKLIKHPEWSLNETQNSSFKWRTKGILTIPIYFQAFFPLSSMLHVVAVEKVVLTVSILVMVSLSRWDFLNWFFLSVPGIYICSWCGARYSGHFQFAFGYLKWLKWPFRWLALKSRWKLKLTLLHSFSTFGSMWSVENCFMNKIKLLHRVENLRESP